MRIYVGIKVGNISGIFREIEPYNIKKYSQKFRLTHAPLDNLSTGWPADLRLRSNEIDNIAESYIPRAQTSSGLEF